MDFRWIEFCVVNSSTRYVGPTTSNPNSNKNIMALIKLGKKLQDCILPLNNFLFRYIKTYYNINMLFLI